MRYLAAFIPLIITGLTAGCLDRGDSDPSAPAIDSTVQPDSFLTFMNESLDVNSEAYATAYYEAVDPLNQRTTLADWKAINGFDAGEDVHVTFRDTKDLGYGRDMYAKSFPDGRVAIYVDNYVVRIEPGDATTYGPLNLGAAIEQDREYHFGTNAIEFSPDSNDPNGNKILKFFTFTPADANGVQHRLIKVDLDGRGDKYMPTMCVVCHGATMYPLRQDGSFDPISLKSPKMNILQQHTFEFSADPGFTEAEQARGIAEINRMVYNTYHEMGERLDGNNATINDDRDDDQANWHSDFAEELLEVTYGFSDPGEGNRLADTSAFTAYQAGAVPSGWAQTADRPGGVDVLYKEVIEPHCIGCHSLRGTKVASNNDTILGEDHHPNAVNFSTFEEFIGYNDLIIDYVYRRGAMPRSLINFDQFWNDPIAPTLLATFLDGFDVFDANGNVVRPGKAVAMPGADRTVASSPATLDASASMFSTAYSWSIVSSTDPNASLSDPSSAEPELTAADGAVVELELTTSNARGNSDPARVTITVDSSFTSYASVFIDSSEPDIRQLLIDATCVSCHSASSAGTGSIYEGIPIYYDEGSYTIKKDLYRNILNRVDLEDPENSLLLRKPTSLQHGGAVVLDRSNPTGNALYNYLLNWIRNGAPCGDDPAFCD